MFRAVRSSWAPVPLRIALGLGLMRHGGIKLFAPGGIDNIAHMIEQLGVPCPRAMGYVVGSVEFFGGLGILVGGATPLAAGANALNIAGLLILGRARGGIPAPLPGGDPLPEFREAALILAGTLSLLVSGPGKLSIG